MAPIMYRTADVDGFKVFYREAGPADAPKLLLLHGFPSASHSSCRRAPRRSSGTILVRLSASSTPVTSPWKRMPAR